MDAGFKGLEGTRIVPSILTNSPYSTYSRAVEARAWYPEEMKEGEDLFVFNHAIEGPRAPAVPSLHSQMRSLNAGDFADGFRQR